MTKPKILFCSASEAKDEMEILAEMVVKDWALPKLWDFGVFGPGESFLDSLLEALDDVDFAVILWTGEDTVISRGSPHLVPRDNLIFELGLAIAKLGTNCVALVMPKAPKLKLPSDYYGRSVVSYDQSTGKPSEYLLSPSLEIKRAFRRNWGSELSGNDFEIHDGSTTIFTKQLGDVVSVSVDTQYRLKAMRRGNFDFNRELVGSSNDAYKGKWLQERCRINDEEPSFCKSNAVIVGKQKILVEQDQEIKLHLASVEEFHISRGFYSWGATSAVHDSEFTWQSEAGCLFHNATAYLYQDTFGMIRMNPNERAKVDKADRGLTILLVWESGH